MRFCGIHRLPENHDCINFKTYNHSPLGTEAYVEIFDEIKNKDIFLSQQNLKPINNDIITILIQLVNLMSKIPRPGMFIEFIGKVISPLSDLTDKQLSKIEYFQARAYKKLGMITKAINSCEKAISLNSELKETIEREFKNEYKEFDVRDVIEDDINYLKCPNCKTKTNIRNKIFEPEPENIINPTPKNIHPTIYHDLIEQHYKKYFGGDSFVLHEFLSQFFHLDVYVFHPNLKLGRDFYILSTCGMGSKRMNVPFEVINKRDRIELMIFLPSDWPLAGTCPTCNKKHGNYEKSRPGNFQDPQFFWPIGNLKFFARYPFLTNCFLGEGHTLAFEEPLQYMSESTQYFGWLIKKPRSYGVSIPELKLSDNSIVKFYTMVPLYKHEMDYKLNFGLEELELKMQRFPQSEIITNKRMPFIV